MSSKKTNSKTSGYKITIEYDPILGARCVLKPMSPIEVKYNHAKQTTDNVFLYQRRPFNTKNK